MVTNQLEQEFRTALEEARPYTDYEVTSRACTSENFDGVEYRISSEWIDIEVVRSVIASHDNIFAESIAVSEGELVIFLVQLDIDPDEDVMLPF